MNTMQGRMMTVKRDGLPYEEMGYCPPPNRKLPPVPGQHSNYNTIDRIKNGKMCFEFQKYTKCFELLSFHKFLKFYKVKMKQRLTLFKILFHFTYRVNNL